MYALAATPVHAATATFKPAADAYVSAAQPGANYGAATRLRADGSPIERAYLRFDVEALSAPVSRATLRLYSYTSTGTGIAVRGISGDSWDERTITYSNAPAIGSVVSKTGSFGANQWVAIDVTPLVTGNGAVSLALTTTSTSSKRFSSREVAAESPELVVTTTSPDPAPPPSPPPGDPVIAAAGDIACDPADPSYFGGSGTTSSCRQTYTSDLLVDAGLTGVLALGDLQYEDGQYANYLRVFDPTWGRVKSITRPVPGNHDYMTPGAAGYFDYFNGIGNPTGPAGDRTMGYYSFDIGSWHFIALNSSCADVGGCQAGSPQEQWLRADLAGHPASCTLAYWHVPRFSSGPRGDSAATKDLWQALYEARADAVLTGHDHNYERFAPQDASGIADPPRGVREFVVGTGGANHAPGFGSIAANSGIRNRDTYGVLELTLRANAYDWKFVPEAGKTFTDSGTDVCDGSFVDTAPPSAPSNLNASALAPSQVSLNWTPSTDDDGVAGYKVFRDGTQIGTSTTTSFLDYTAQPATSYGYHVVAYDPAGRDSAASGTATITTPGTNQLLTFSPTDDAYVRADMPNTNFGSSTTLQVDNSPVKSFLLKFSVSGVGANPVAGAKLRLYATDASNAGGSFYRVGDPTWREHTVTWSTAPAADALPVGSLGGVSSGRWYEVDVSPLVTGDGIVSLRVTSPSSDGADYASKEGTAGTTPQLLVTVTTAPTPSGSPPPPAPQPAFPIRAAFYYPWYPEAWDQQGIYPFTKYDPSLGFYRSDDQTTRRSHLRSLEHAHFDAGIYSWWGQKSKEDLRLPGMLADTSATGSPIKWALYYEKEGNADPTAAEIGSDLDYIKSSYAAHPAYLKVGDKPVIFVYGGVAEDCQMVDRWREANTDSRGFYVVLKVFSGHRTCASQPDAWHQYSPANRTDHQVGSSFTISPEFDPTGPDPALLPRDLTAFEQAIDEMVTSNEPWQLVTTFNEWGENSATESAEQWPSASGHGRYLDALSARP